MDLHFPFKRVCIPKLQKKQIRQILELILVVGLLVAFYCFFTFKTIQLEKDILNYKTYSSFSQRIVFENTLQSSLEAYLISLKQLLLGAVAAIAIAIASFRRFAYWSEAMENSTSLEEPCPEESSPPSQGDPPSPSGQTRGLQEQQAFLAVVAHELKTPLTGVLAYIESTLRLSTGPSARLLQKAREVTDQLIGNLNNMLDSSRLFAGKMNLQPQKVSMSALIAEVAQVLALSAERKGLAFYLEAPLFQSDWVCLDPLRVKQVLINLLSNSIKFTDTGSVWLSVHQHLVDDSHGEVTFRIVDTGKGITEPQLEKLFAAHIQQSDQSHARYGGFGLGLSICKQLVDLMNGRIALSNRSQGHGTQAEVVIPVQCLQHSAVVPDVMVSPEQTPILIVVGADTIECEIIARTIGVAYFAVHRFVTLAECFASCEDELSDPTLVLDLIVIVSHLTFEGLGRQGSVDKQLRAFRRSLGLVGFSDQSRSLRQLMEAGISDYLFKPATALQIFLQWFRTTPEDAQGEGNAQAHQIEAALRGMRVLLVEDTDCLRDLTASSLQSFGAIVDCASNGAEATSMALNPLNRYDFVLMDIHMPYVDGVQAACRIRTHFDSHALPIFALTAYTQEFELNRCLQAGMNACLSKPIDFMRLARLIEGPFRTSAATEPMLTAKSDPLSAQAPLIDLDAARQKFAGRQVLLVKAFDLFLRDADYFESQLKRESVDTLAFPNLVHKLHGAAGMIGAERLRRMAAAIERAMPPEAEQEQCRLQLLQLFVLTRNEVASLMVRPQ